MNAALCAKQGYFQEMVYIPFTAITTVFAVIVVLLIFHGISVQEISVSELGRSNPGHGPIAQMLQRSNMVPNYLQLPISPRVLDVFQQQVEDRRKSVKKILEERAKSFLVFYNTVVPEVLCAELVRIGTTGDGGKWMCSPHNLPTGCTFISLGLSNRVSFDTDLQDMIGNRCKLVAVDLNKQSNATLKDLTKHNGKTVVAKIGQAEGELSITELVERENISKVDLMKIDIEGAEYQALLPFLDNFVVSQILIEIHAHFNAYKMVGLLNELAKRGYWIANYEINGAHIGLSEYTLIHDSALSNYLATPLARYMLF